MCREACALFDFIEEIFCMKKTKFVECVYKICYYIGWYVERSMRSCSNELIKERIVNERKGGWIHSGRI